MKHDVIDMIQSMREDLGSRVTDFELNRVNAFDIVQGLEQERLSRMGIILHGSTDCLFLVENANLHVGRIIIHNGNAGNVFVFGGLARNKNSIINIRVNGSGVCVFAPELGPMPVNINDLFMRNNDQLFFWGRKASCTGAIFEIEGRGKKIIFGDDCMLSGSINVRNHDMHTIFDIVTGKIINKEPSNITIEKHVWIGYDAMILSCKII